MLRGNCEGEDDPGEIRVGDKFSNNKLNYKSTPKINSKINFKNTRNNPVHSIRTQYILADGTILPLYFDGWKCYLKYK